MAAQQPSLNFQLFNNPVYETQKKKIRGPAGLTSGKKALSALLKTSYPAVKYSMPLFEFRHVFNA